MARPIIKPSLVVGERLKRTAAALRAAGREDLRREVDREIKAEGEPTLDELRASARRVRIVGLPTGSPKKFTMKSTDKHLRERMAEATVLEVRASDRETRVSFHVRSSQMGKAHAIPRYVDQGKQWRHPVMANRDRWAASRGEPWFFPPIRDRLPKFRERIRHAIDVVADKVEKA